VAKELGGPTLAIAGVDMMDGTPLLGLKPYMPLFDGHSPRLIGRYRSRLTLGARDMRP